MVAAKMAVAVPIVVQSQLRTTNGAFVSFETESAIRVETLFFRNDICFLRTFRALFERRIIPILHCSVAVPGKALLKRCFDHVLDRD